MFNGHFIGLCIFIGVESTLLLFLLPDCEACKSFFTNKCEFHGPAVFIPDTPVPVGVTDRARLTLPLGLEVRQSNISATGLGVFNTGETVPAGANFGPYEGELVDREEAMNSGYSWVVSPIKNILHRCMENEASFLSLLNFCYI